MAHVEEYGDSGGSGQVDYSQYSHQELYNMVQTGSPGNLGGASADWTNHATTFSEAADLLNQGLGLQSEWQGTAAETFFAQVQSVANKAQNSADSATSTAAALSTASDALSTARSNMPAVPSELEQAAASVQNHIGIFGALDPLDDVGPPGDHDHDGAGELAVGPRFTQG